MFAHATNSSGFHGFQGLGQFFAQLTTIFSRAQAASRTHRRLSRLSDRALAARGLTRDDVTRLTLAALDGRTGA